MPKKKKASGLTLGEQAAQSSVGARTKSASKADRKTAKRPGKGTLGKTSSRTKTLLAGSKPPGSGKKGDKPPMNMVSNEPLVGKGKRDEPVPAIAKRVLTKTVAAGKKQRIRVPVRTGTAGGRPGGGSTGETSPARDTASGRGHGQKRSKR